MKQEVISQGETFTNWLVLLKKQQEAKDMQGDIELSLQSLAAKSRAEIDGIFYQVYFPKSDEEILKSMEAEDSMPIYLHYMLNPDGTKAILVRLLVELFRLYNVHGKSNEADGVEFIQHTLSYLLAMFSYLTLPEFALFVHWASTGSLGKKTMLNVAFVLGELKFFRRDFDVIRNSLSEVYQKTAPLECVGYIKKLIADGIIKV